MKTDRKLIVFDLNHWPVLVVVSGCVRLRTRVPQKHKEASSPLRATSKGLAKFTYAPYVGRLLILIRIKTRAPCELREAGIDPD